MFGGYTDVAAYYMDAGDLSINTNGYDGSLPQEFTPVLPAVNPWNAGTSFREDFILIAEFSEQEGPKPLVSKITHILRLLNQPLINRFNHFIFNRLIGIKHQANNIDYQNVEYEDLGKIF